MSRKSGILGRWIVVVLVTVSLLGSPHSLRASGPADDAGSKKSPTGHSLPGVAAAEAVTALTGVAISPLLGVGMMGAWRYFKTPDIQRNQLIWYAQPWFWGTALVLVLMCAIKDVGGLALPRIAKKILDAAEVLENKLSGLVATGAIVPWLLLLSQDLSNATNGNVPMRPSLVASMGSGLGLAVPVILLGLIFYTAVFLVFHVSHLMVLLSPFRWLDLLIKGGRVGILAMLTAASWVNPFAGALLALAIVGASLVLLPWACRWLVYGHVLVWDFIFHWHRWRPKSEASIHGFLARPWKKWPSRTRVHVEVVGDSKGITLWPMLGSCERLQERRIRGWVIKRGLLQLEVRGELVSGDEISIQLLPRYSECAEWVAAEIGAREIQPAGLLAAWQWVRQTLVGPAPING